MAMSYRAVLILGLALGVTPIWAAPMHLLVKTQRQNIEGLQLPSLVSTVAKAGDATVNLQFTFSGCHNVT